MASLKADLLTVMENLNLTLEALQENVVVLKKAVLQTSPRASNAPPKVRVLELKGFDGARSSNELEKFLWNKE